MEYEDVLTNQPVVIDNVREANSLNFRFAGIKSFRSNVGIWRYKGWVCGRRPAQVLLPSIVRFPICESVFRQHRIDAKAALDVRSIDE